MGETLSSLPPGDKHPHGTRARYVGAKCRCIECRAANAAYYHERQKLHKEKLAELGGTATSGPCPGFGKEPCAWGTNLRKDSKGGVCARCREKAMWNGLVSADIAREHLKTLSKRHVGYKSVAEAAGISESVMFKILTGERKQIRNQNSLAILAVDESARADAAIVDGKETRKLIRKMVTMGYPRCELAKRMGYKSPALQLKRKVLVRNAHKIKKLYAEILEEQEVMKELKHLCNHCGRSHHKLNRQRHLKASLPATSEVLREVLACFYGDGSSKAEQDLSRDLRAIGAIKEGSKQGKGPWQLL